MKKFVYQVAGFEFVDSVAFGKAWQEAKQVAIANHAPIYRLVIKGEAVRQEVFYTSGCFNSVEFAAIHSIKIF